MVSVSERKMIGKLSPLIELHWPNFDPWAVAAVRHKISGHPLLQINQLVELAKRLESHGRIRAHRNDAQAGTSFADAADLHPIDSPLIQTIEHIEAAGAWMSLLNVQTDLQYRDLVDE